MSWRIDWAARSDRALRSSEAVAAQCRGCPPYGFAGSVRQRAAASASASTALLLVLLAAGCSSQKLVCDELTQALQQCGFPVSELQCDGVTAADLEALSQRFGERHCDAFSSGDRSVDPRLCALAGWKCPGSPIPAPATDQPPHGALVLVSGIDGSPLFDWNPSVEQALRAANVPAYHVQVLPWATTSERAADLWQSLRSLRAHTGSLPFNLVCYAVGGLDCRYLVSPGGMFANDASQLAEVRQTIGSVTTIATPHRGTKVALAARQALEDGTVSDVLQALVGDGTDVHVPGNAALLRTLDGLTPDAVSKLNRSVTDAPGLPYFSWAGISHLLGRASTGADAQVAQHCGRYLRHDGTRDVLDPLLWATVGFSFESRGDDGADVTSPSDGMVSVESAKWGTFMGCLPADHYDVVGELGHTTRDPVTGFDAVGFWQFVAAELSLRGL